MLPKKGWEEGCVVSKHVLKYWVLERKRCIVAGTAPQPPSVGMEADAEAMARALASLRVL